MIVPPKYIFAIQNISWIHLEFQTWISHLDYYHSILIGPLASSLIAPHTTFDQSFQQSEWSFKCKSNDTNSCLKIFTGFSLKLNPRFFNTIYKEGPALIGWFLPISPTQCSTHDYSHKFLKRINHFPVGVRLFHSTSLTIPTNPNFIHSWLLHSFFRKTFSELQSN